MFKVLFVTIIFLFFLRNCCFAQQDSVVSKEQLNYELLTFAYEGEADNIKLWLEKGADVNAVSDKGISALMYAVQNGNMQSVMVLVANGADINYEPFGEVSALASAVINNKIEIVDYLLSKKADINIKDNQGITPLMYAAAYGYYDIARLLIKYKPDLSLKDEYGNDALMASVEYNHPDVTELLLQKGANVNTTDQRKFTPLMLASQNGWVSYIDLFNKSEPDYSIKNIYGNDALEIAILNHQDEMLNKLLSLDSTREKFKGNPVKLCYLSGNRDFVKILRKRGYKPYFYPIFDKISLGYGVDLNLKDMMFGFTIGMRETRYNFLITVSHFTRYWAKRSIIDYGNDIYYQFWETRSILSFGLDKRIKLTGENNKQNGILLGAGESLTYGKYRGAFIKPASFWKLSPHLGLYSEGKSGGISLTLEYFDIKVENIPPIRANINAYIYIGLRRLTTYKKMPEW